MRTAPLGDVCEVITDGTHASPERVDSGVPVLSAQNVKTSGLDITTSRFTSERELTAFERRFRPRRGDVLMTIVGTIGRVTVLEEEPRAVFQRSVAFLRPRADVLDCRYLALTSQSPQFKGQLARATNRSSQAGVYLSKLKAIEVPLPPLAEQRRVAAILDHADALRAKRRQVLIHLEALTRSIFRSAFAGVAGTSRLGDLATTTSGGTPNRSVSSNYGGGIPWVKSGELHAGLVTETEETISAQGLSSSSAKVLPAGTVLLAMYGATAGVVGRLGLDAATNQAVCAITPGPSLDAEYLIAALRSQTVQLVAKAAGGAQPNLSQGIIRDIVIPVPSLDDQKRFATQVAAIDAQRSDVARAQAMEGDLFASLQARAFRGDL